VARYIRVPGRVRWPIAVVIAIYSFIGRAPAEAVEWLSTGRGRLALLLFALVVGFWPQLSEWTREQIVGYRTGIRPVTNRRLQKEAKKLAAEMQAYAASHNSRSEEYRDWTDLLNRMDTATTEGEKFAILHEEKAKKAANSFEQTQRLSELFGGRVSFVMNEFEKRGMASGAERKSLIEWKAQSVVWLPEAAVTIASLATRLGEAI
jgi:hypothetical protein